jgi:hypothetical protein
MNMTKEEENSFVRLIWDFRGPDGLKTAEHHAIHLREFFKKEGIADLKVDCNTISDIHTTAFAEVPMEKMIEFRDALKPNRGEYVE